MDVETSGLFTFHILIRYHKITAVTTFKYKLVLKYTVY